MVPRRWRGQTRKCGILKRVDEDDYESEISTVSPSLEQTEKLWVVCGLLGSRGAMPFVEKKKNE